ncbi:MAG: ABC transporter substrate-binding protein [Alphaproteobacteria bacterium]|nr:ABC transporter substrate-binding protein [Alphaproteobacteria bacterium]
MQKLKLIVFEGVQNLPIFAAQAQGYFADEGLDIDLSFTPDSGVLRKGLAAGEYDIAHTAVDNAIAMVELAKVDVAVILGGDSGFNALVFQPDVGGFEDLRGQTVLVDAPNTAFALVLYRILELHGLKRGDYAAEPVGATPFRLKRMLSDRLARASIMNLPFRIQAERAGLRVACEAIDEIGPYLSTAGFVLRAWAERNADVLTAYCRAYIRGLRWALASENHATSIDILAQRLRLAPDIAAEGFAMAATPGGLARDAEIDMTGLANVLRLRAAVEGQWQGIAPPAENYVDRKFRDAAARSLENASNSRSRK